MKERLVIKNFGPIQEVDLELGKMTVLIGDQATGKTTIAKVLAVCRYFSYVTGKSISIFGGENSFSKGLNEWGIVEFIKSDSVIIYECDDYSVDARCRTTLDVEVGNPFDHSSFQALLIPKSDAFKKLKEEYDSFENQEFVPSQFYLGPVTKVMNNPLFLPTERGLQSLFSLGRNTLNNISDALFNQFAKIDQCLKAFGEKEIYLEPLNITYKNVNGRAMVKKDGEDEFYSLSNGASGYQAATPIILAVKSFSDPKSFIIEEPEINLFPESQKRLVEFLAKEMSSHKHSFILPTHSPYIISSLNNLLVAYRIGKVKPELVEKIVPKSLWLNPDQQESNDVRAYRLYYDETKKGVVSSSLIDENLQEIKINYLDGVSTAINSIWDQLIELEDEN